MIPITQRIAEELHVRLAQVEAAIALLDDKATVPFIARYRKEATGGLDDTQLRMLEERLTYLREFEERRSTILASIDEQGKLTPELSAAIAEADTKARLEELIRIEPKAIGVGPYQHDVNQIQLARKLDAVVEDCVNAVGADVNTASAPLLARISGLNAATAKNLVAFRDEHGPFRNRRQILKVLRLGDRTFQQAAGFLRITGGDNPLDASAVHPEAYPLVERIVERTGLQVGMLMGNAAVLRTLIPESLADTHPRPHRRRWRLPLASCRGRSTPRSPGVTAPAAGGRPPSPPRCGPAGRCRR